MPLFEENDSMMKRHEWVRWREQLSSKKADLTSGGIPSDVFGLLYGEPEVLRKLSRTWCAKWFMLSFDAVKCTNPDMTMGSSWLDLLTRSLIALLCMYMPYSAHLCLACAIMQNRVPAPLPRYEYGVAHLVYVNPLLRTSSLPEMVDDWIVAMNAVCAVGVETARVACASYNHVLMKSSYL